MKLRKSINTGLTLSLCSASFCWVVLNMASLAEAQVVQLPTFQMTGVDTTVWVPDGGSIVLGGGTNSSYGSTSRGVPGLSGIPGAGRMFGNRAIGSASSTHTISVSAQIHDLRAMDEGLLAEAAARRGGASNPRFAMENAKADFISRNVEKRTDDRFRLVSQPKGTTPSVEEIRAQNELTLDRQNDEARAYLEQGREAEAAGKPGVAKIFYNMAARRATGDLKPEVLQRLAAVSGPSNKNGQFAAQTAERVTTGR